MKCTWSDMQILSCISRYSLQPVGILAAQKKRLYNCTTKC